MGSFSVSCSASNISISEGTAVAFILLEPSKNYKIKNKQIPTLHRFTYSDDLYEPTSLPIFGRYNDYGSIDDIVMDGNVKSLEKYYGMSIYDIISIITDGRDLLDHCSEALNIYNINKISSNDKINSENLLKLGFKEENGFFIKEGSNLKLKVIPDERDNGYSFCTLDGHDNRYFLNNLFDLQKEIFNDFNYIISLPSDKQDFVRTLKILGKTSAMFVHKEIYDTFVTRTYDGKKEDVIYDNLSKRPHPIFFECYDFEISKDKNAYNKYFIKIEDITFDYEHDSLRYENNSFYEMTDVFNFLDKKGIVLNRSLIRGIDVFSEKIKYLVKNLPEIDEENSLTREIRRGKLENLKELILPSSTSSKWRIFSDIYLSALDSSDFSFIEELKNFYYFSYNFGSSNHIFAPIVNGDQYGDVEMSKLLYKKAYSIVSNKEKDSIGDNVVDGYRFNKNIDNSREYLLEIIEDYQPSIASDISGLSLFEIELFKKDNSILEEILKTYC